MSRTRLIKAVAIALIAAALFCMYWYVVKTTGFMPRCVVKWSTGLDCPGCGTQRAIMALLAGKPLQAAASNLLLVPAVVYLSLLAAAWLFPRSGRLQSVQRVITSSTALRIVAALSVGWMVIRNIIGI